MNKSLSGYNAFNVYISLTDNKRLDEWVTIDRLDLTKLQPPSKDQKTPLKELKKPSSGSRAASPEREQLKNAKVNNVSIVLSPWYIG